MSQRLTPGLSAELEYMQFLLNQGYSDPKPIAGRRIAFIMPLMFTHAIIVARIGDEYSYDDRWCYHAYASAKAALDAWDGVGEPIGWHRHPATGRRRENDVDIGVW